MGESVETRLRTAPGAAAALRRSGKNINGYCGERIEIYSVLEEIERTAARHHWEKEVFLQAEAVRLVALHKNTRNPLRKVYISAGIHGDEPAGPLAVRKLLNEDHWPAGLDLWICPCLNPVGFVLNRRENSEGFDLNRQYLEPKAEEIVAHIRWLQRQPQFDLCLCLHEDWESHGFYIYELNPDHRPSLAEAMLAQVARICPIDRSEVIEGRPAHNGIIRPSAELQSRPQWPEAFFLHRHKTRLSYTLEAPSDFPLNCRVAALAEAVRTALQSTADVSKGPPGPLKLPPGCGTPSKPARDK